MTDFSHFFDKIQTDPILAKKFLEHLQKFTDKYSLDYIKNHVEHDSLIELDPISISQDIVTNSFPTIELIDPDMINVALHNPSLFRENNTEDYIKQVGRYPTVLPPPKSSEEMTTLIHNLIANQQKEQLKITKNNYQNTDEEDITINLYRNELSAKDIQNAFKTNITWIDSYNVNLLKQELANAGNKEKNDKLNSYFNRLQTEKPIVTVADYTIFDNLLKKTPNFLEVIKFLKGSFKLNQSRSEENYYNVPTPILLLGDPGIGKTYFAKLLAQHLGTTFHFLDSNSITASWVLTGSTGQWQSADCGWIFKFMLDSKTISPVVIFDEIDKLSSGKNYDPFSVFHQLLEPENSKTFKDEFINASFDASKIIYILTANKINDIPDSLISRMRVFDIKQPDKDATRKIAQGIYSEVIGSSLLFPKTLTESNLKKLENLSPRHIKKLLSHSVFTQACEDSENTELVIYEEKDLNTRIGF